MNLLTLLAIISAIYFGAQNLRLKSANKELLNDTQIESNNSSKKQLSNIDSLLIQGQYSEAFNQYRSLENDTLLSNMYDLDFRIKMSKQLAQLSIKPKLGETEAQNDQKLDSLETMLNQKESSNTSDLELKKAKQEIRRLKSQLSSSNSNDYLVFKTSKGTKLHYIGGVKNNKANGYGIAIFETGSRYEGQWSDNLRHGEGKFYWNDGEIYEGRYRNDKRDGFGIYFWENGEKYVGDWKQDRRDGEGKFYNKRGKLKASGLWKDDELVEEN